MTCSLPALVDELSLSTWTLSAIATLFESGLAEALREPRTVDELATRVEALPRERIARVLDLLAFRGVVTRDNDRYTLADGVAPLTQPPMRAVIAGELRATLMLANAYVDAARSETPVRGWHHTNPRLLQAQGDASAGFVGAFRNHFVPQLGDLASRLEQPTARFLDVGVGVGSLAIGMCRAFPQLRATGLDVFDVPLGMARDNVARAGLADRIELRQHAIEDLRDEAAFDYCWFPAFFLAPSSLPAAVARIREALRPGGWILMSAMKTDTDDAHRVVYSMVMESWGTVVDTASAETLLKTSGFTTTRTIPGPWWGALVVGQR